jgi:hypothetical protein
VGGLLSGAGWKRASIAVIGVLMASAAGCSSGASSSSAAAPATPAQTTPVQEVQLAASTAGTVSSFSATISLGITTKGTSLGSQSVSMAGTLSEEVHPLRVEAAFSALQAAGLSLGGMSEILTPDEIYLKLPELSTLLHTAKPWLGLPVSSLSSGSGLNLNSLFSQSDTSNPLTMAQLLAGAKDVKAVGTGTVDGVPVTEYTGTFALASAVDRLPASERSAVNSAFKQVGLTTGTARFTVWIDAQHIVRKDDTVLESSTFSENISMTVTSVNQPVAITSPPASQVYPLSSADMGSVI